MGIPPSATARQPLLPVLERRRSRTSPIRKPRAIRRRRVKRWGLLLVDRGRTESPSCCTKRLIASIRNSVASKPALRNLIFVSAIEVQEFATVQTERKLRATTLLMAVGVGVAVANIYYCQPLLGIMGRDLHVSDHRIGWIAMLTQAGTALGMLLFVPLGDIVERRALNVRMCVFVAFAAILNAVAPSYSLLALFSFVLG